MRIFVDLIDPDVRMMRVMAELEQPYWMLTKEVARAC